jgi:hypothetical protein
MALILKDRVQETATANTTVSFSLAGAVTGFQTFSSAIGSANTTYYSATDASGNWEVGTGTYVTIGNLLNRTTVTASSNAGSAVTFSGTVTVFVTYPASKVLTPTGTSSQLLANDGASSISNVTVGTGLSFSAGTLANTVVGGATTVKLTTYTSGSGTFTTDAKTLYAEVICTGGGGGGGGSDSSSTSAGIAAGGGGGGGGTAIKWYTLAELGATSAYAVGAAGTAGVAAGGTGGAGGSSTFNPIGTGLTITGAGGGGGIGCGSAYASQGGTFAGGAGGGATNGDFNHTGLDGLIGFSYYVSTAAPAANRLSVGGNGGASYWGGGAQAPTQWSTTIIGSATGVAATIQGAGGSGSYNAWTTAGRAGGAGADGEILVLEYLSA